MPLRTVGIILLVAALGVAALTLRTVHLAGYFRSIEPHFNGTCRLVEGLVGAEDIAIDRGIGAAYLSGYDRRAAIAGKPVPGAIHYYDLKAAGAVPVNLTPDADTSFQPHGISLWISPEGRRVLYAINHPAPGTRSYQDSVEVFDVESGALRHRTTIIDTRLVMPNDIVAVAEDQFYLTNTHANPRGRMQTIETYLRLRGANVLRYGRQGFRPVAENLVFPNGINASPDGLTIYVATTTTGEVLVYDRDPATGALTFRNRVAVGIGLDNIDVDGDGDLWIGTHPKLLALGPHGENPANLSPSQVLRARFGTGAAEVDEVFLDRGDRISGISVAARDGDRLLLGQIFGEGILDCTMSPRAAP